MPAIASIALDDAAGTPVTHTFTPIGTDKNGAWWFEDQAAASSAIGYNRLSIQIVRAGNPAPGSNAGNRVNRVKIGFHTPTLETLGTSDDGLTPPPTVAYIDRANLEFIWSERDSLQNRKDLRKFLYGLLNVSNVKTLVENLENFY